MVCVRGAAWSGHGEIVKVEISLDSGATWNMARLSGEAGKYAWRLWEYEWETPSQQGQHSLMARASDSLGQTQPLERSWDRGTYMINHVLPVQVVVS